MQINGASDDKQQSIALARRLLRGCDRATLATPLRNDHGWPYPSFVLTACDYDGSPLLFLSGLAEHTRNAAADNRIGLLFQATDGLAEPLSGPRLSLLGRLTPCDAPQTPARFLARHPSAQRLTALGDFRFFRVAIARAHLVGGFGRARWLDAETLLTPPALSAQQTATAETACLTRLNASPRPDGWIWSGIDPDGADLRRNEQVRRIGFPAPAANPADWPSLCENIAESDIY